jgi:hypothetical protein
MTLIVKNWIWPLQRDMAFNMAVGKPEVVITSVRNKISTQVQRHAHIFDVARSNTTYNDNVRRQASVSFSNRTNFQFCCLHLCSPALLGVALCHFMRHSIELCRKYDRNRWNRVDILFQTKVVTISGSNHYLGFLTSIDVIMRRCMRFSIGYTKTWV